MKRVCIFCGARPGNDPRIIEQVNELCDLLIEQDFDLVYGGGNSGLMGLIADRFLAGGKQVIGIRPKKLIVDEAMHTGISKMIVVDDMFERKMQMMDEADYFISLSGGAGTLDELLEVYTQVKIGFTDKFCGVLNTDEFYDGLETLLQRMVKNEFLLRKDKALLKIANTPKDLMAEVITWERQLPEIDKLAYVHLENKQILMTRSKGKTAYYIPGGKRDPGETDQQALLREIKEELNVEIDPSSIEYVGTFRAQADGKPVGVEVKMTFYDGAYFGDLKASSEIEEVRWMNFREIDLVSNVDKKIFRFLERQGLLR